MLTPRLPAGYHAQPAFHHQDGFTSFEFYRAYNTARELDPLRSYWLLITAEDTRGPMPPKARWLAFVDWAYHQHKGESDYPEFANPQTPPDAILRWVNASQSGDLVTIREM